MRRNLHLVVSLALPLALAATACSSTKTITSASAPPGTVADTVGDTVGDTVPLPTDPPATDLPTTTAVPAGFFLRVNGVGPLSFGASQGDVISTLTDRLGPTTSDELLDFPIDNGVGFFENIDGDVGFVFSAARHTCFLNEFCVTFGGGSADSALFVGWSFRGTESPDSLTTEHGITIGSRQSDFLADMTAFEGGCFTVGGGETNDGIALTLVSELVPFFEFDSSGNPINHLPDPTDITVLEMESGTQLLDLVGDC